MARLIRCLQRSGGRFRAVGRGAVPPGRPVPPDTPTDARPAAAASPFSAAAALRQGASACGLRPAMLGRGASGGRGVGCHGRRPRQHFAGRGAQGGQAVRPACQAPAAPLNPAVVTPPWGPRAASSGSRGLPRSREPHRAAGSRTPLARPGGCDHPAAVGFDLLPRAIEHVVGGDEAQRPDADVGRDALYRHVAVREAELDDPAADQRPGEDDRDREDHRAQRRVLVHGPPKPRVSRARGASRRDSRRPSA